MYELCIVTRTKTVRIQTSTQTQTREDDSVTECVLGASGVMMSVCGLSSEDAQEATTSQPTEGQLPGGQWMTQSFADQIPDISGAAQGDGV